EERTDPWVERDTADDVVDLHVQFFADARDLIDEGDSRGEERVRDVLDHLGRAQVGQDDWSVEALIELGDGFGILALTGANHDAVRREEVLDDVALSKEFRIGHDSRGMSALDQPATEDSLDRLARPDWGRALVDDHRVGS